MGRCSPLPAATKRIYHTNGRSITTKARTTMSDSQVTLVGNITRDPELRYTPSGQAVCRLGIAVNRRWQNRQTNEWEEQVSFFNVTAWASLAENAGESIHKGMRAIIVGRLDQRSWETPEGEKRSVVEVTADSIGPDLRWATASTVRNERKDGSAPHPAMAGASVGNADDGIGDEPF